VGASPCSLPVARVGLVGSVRLGGHPGRGDFHSKGRATRSRLDQLKAKHFNLLARSETRFFWGETRFIEKTGFLDNRVSVFRCKILAGAKHALSICTLNGRPILPRI
jgi:hypothetical protein